MAVIQSANSGTTSPAWPSYVCKTRIDMQQESTHVYAPGCGMVERGTNICATAMSGSGRTEYRNLDLVSICAKIDGSSWTESE